ncbi:MAG: diacylglycerol kinase family protein [Propionibacteriaceae bacterium]|nr:diacylglycerol kinase family protein [Propionibacteriaceae bacterium]
MSTPGTVAIIVNPTKFADLDEVKQRAAEVAAQEGWAEPRWYETTVEDPGYGQAKEAVRDGATLVCSLGGDGTVRSVVKGLLEERPPDDEAEVPLGLLPGGTGNLLARNLGLPIDNLADALQIALTGTTRRIDVGRASFDDGDVEVFLVAAGVGLDAETMAAVDEGVKKRVGWVAYVLAAGQSLLRKGFRVSVTADGHRARSQHARTVMVGNCGELTAGAQLMPDAQVDDGLLDALVVSPRGALGWGAVLLDFATRHRLGHPSVKRVQAKKVEITLGKLVEGELDGDAVGQVRALLCEVHESALPIRVQAEPEGWR